MKGTDWVHRGGRCMQTLYMPLGFDEEVWRDTPEAWLPELRERGVLESDGAVPFLIADLLGSVEITIDEGRKITADMPPTANCVSLIVDGEVWDQGASIREIEERLDDGLLIGVDCPITAELTFWHHHQVARRIQLVTSPTRRELLALQGMRAAMDLAHATARNAGWYHDPKTGHPIERNVGEVIALMHSELSEGLEAHRRDLMDDKLPHRTGIEVEFADCILRILDTAAALNLDVAGAIIEKNRFNQVRADHKLAARAAGGKKY